jgi:Uma2 family endonuclease
MCARDGASQIGLAGARGRYGRRMEILLHPGPYTEDDLPDDNRLVELLEGTLLVNPPPSTLHQAVIEDVRVRARVGIPDDYEALQAVGIRMPGGSYFIPDVAVIAKERIRADVSTLDPSEVLMVAEVISPGSRSMDREIKPKLYAEAGIKEFWLVIPEEQPEDSVVERYRLEDATGGSGGRLAPGAYILVETFDLR